MRVLAEFSAKTWKTRRKWNDIFNTENLKNFTLRSQKDKDAHSHFYSTWYSMLVVILFTVLASKKNK